MDLWQEHLRIDRELREELVRANARVDALRKSNDANVKIMDRAVAQNERLVAALALANQKGGEGDEA